MLRQKHCQRLLCNKKALLPIANQCSHRHTSIHTHSNHRYIATSIPSIHRRRRRHSIPTTHPFTTSTTTSPTSPTTATAAAGAAAQQQQQRPPKEHDEFNITFHSRPLGLDIRFDTVSHSFKIERSAWKQVLPQSTIATINGIPIKECITFGEDETNEDTNEKEDESAVREGNGNEEMEMEMEESELSVGKLIEYLQGCELPLQITFKYPDSDDSTAMAQIMRPPSKKMKEMSATEILDYLETNFDRQLLVYRSNRNNAKFIEKHRTMATLFSIFDKANIDSFGDNIRPLIDNEKSSFFDRIRNKPILLSYEHNRIDDIANDLDNDYKSLRTDEIVSQSNINQFDKAVANILSCANYAIDKLGSNVESWQEYPLTQTTVIFRDVLQLIYPSVIRSLKFEAPLFTDNIGESSDLMDRAQSHLSQNRHSILDNFIDCGKSLGLGMGELGKVSLHCQWILDYFVNRHSMDIRNKSEQSRLENSDELKFELLFIQSLLNLFIDDTIVDNLQIDGSDKVSDYISLDHFFANGECRDMSDDRTKTGKYVTAINGAPVTKALLTVDNTHSILTQRPLTIEIRTIMPKSGAISDILRRSNMDITADDFLNWVTDLISSDKYTHINSELGLFKSDPSMTRNRTIIYNYLQSLDTDQFSINHLSQNHLEALRREIVMAQSADGSDSNSSIAMRVPHINSIILGSIAHWIHSVLDMIRIYSDESTHLQSYLMNQRPSDLINDHSSMIADMSSQELQSWLSQTYQMDSCNNDQLLNRNVSQTSATQSSPTVWEHITQQLHVRKWDGRTCVDATVEELCDLAPPQLSDIDKQGVGIRLYAMLHNMSRTATPTFDLMMSRRQQMRDSMAMFDGSFWDDSEVSQSLQSESGDESADIGKQMSQLMQMVDDKLLKEEKPDWFTYDAEIEQWMAQSFLKNFGFDEHAHKFHSMTLLSRAKRAELKAMDIYVPERKKIVRETNKWLELQNIIKYGEYPYYQSDGSRSQIPSAGQVYGEIGYTKYDKVHCNAGGNAPDVTPDNSDDYQTPPIANTFWAPIVGYKELRQLMRDGFNPKTWQKKKKQLLSQSESK